MAISLTFQTVVYGNTWAAVNAACAAAQNGAKTALVSPYPHIGGCIANGLSNIDQGRYGSHGFGYMTNRFFVKNSAMSGSRILLPRVSPIRAEAIFDDMLKSYGVYVFTSYPLASVAMSSAAITSITCSDANTTTFNGTVFIDGTEEGDLAAGTGTVTMVYGRESNTYFSSASPSGGLIANPPSGSTWITAGEALAGFYPVASTFTAANCYESNGTTLLPGYTAYPATAVGGADLGIPAYGFRLCLTQNPPDKAPWPKPANYSTDIIQHLINQIPSDQTNWIPFSATMCIDGKQDFNQDFGIPYQWGWPSATPAARVTILEQMFNEQASWLWFLANDPSITPAVQDYVNSWGPSITEFRDTASTPYGATAGWPYEVYVRKGRRMYGQYIMTQADLQTSTTKTDAIACGFYSMDEHTNQRLATTQNSVAGYVLDAFGADTTQNRQVVPGYQIPFRAVLPVASQCTNLMVPVAASMSSVAAASMRIDVHKANVGAACGVAAAMSVTTSTPLNSLNVTTLQTTLTTLGQVISYTAP